MRNPTLSRKQIVVFAGLMLASAGWGYQATSASNAPSRDEMLSFYMWCLDMRLYPAERCDARRPDDVKAYEQYRAAAEQFDQGRAAREKREQQLNERLNPDSATAKQGPASR
jgi:hypothetical protein